MSEPSSAAIWERDWPADGLEAVRQCPVCGSSDRSLAIDDMLDNVFFAAPGRWTLKRCSQCACAYLDPRPTPATIGDAYAKYYTHDAARATSRAGFVRHIYFSIVDLYEKGRYRHSGWPAAVVAALIGVIAPPLANRQDSWHRWLDRFRPGMSLLDAGCGNGAFLTMARDLGWDVEGFDLDEQAVQTAKNASVRAYVGNLESLGGMLRAPYDAITMNHVIEHVYDPKRDLELAYGLLKPGGQLFLETPNIDALNFQTFGIHWRGLEAPRHLVLFNPAGLKALLKLVGFVDIKIRRHVVFNGVYQASSKAEARFNGVTMPRRAGLLEKLKGNLAPQARLEFITMTARKPAA